LTSGSFFGILKKKEVQPVDDLYYMDEALALAREAAADGEVPVGCVIVRGDQIVGRGRNRRETGKTALGHAEIEAIEQACQTLGGWRLWECTLYVTLEPCPMCAGAIVNARIPRVVFGASDAKCGACGSVCDIFSMDFNHHPQVESGVREEESSKLLSEFFKDLRVQLRTRPKWKKPTE
jgi:tRNA(adenine34) deaminase